MLQILIHLLVVKYSNTYSSSVHVSAVLLRRIKIRVLNRRFFKEAKNDAHIIAILFLFFWWCSSHRCECFTRELLKPTGLEKTSLLS